jgi:hypothetical protein
MMTGFFAGAPSCFHACTSDKQLARSLACQRPVVLTRMKPCRYAAKITGQQTSQVDCWKAMMQAGVQASKPACWLALIFTVKNVLSSA